MRFIGTICSGCGAELGPADATYVCPSCGSNLDVRLDMSVPRPRAEVEQSTDRSMWRYAPLLPVPPPDDSDGPLCSVGGTPLVRADRVARSAGVARAWIKDEGRQPTGSLKDRASAVVVQRAREMGVQTLVTASTGNAGVALAAMACAAGLEAVILVPESAPRAKIAQLQIFGARLLLVRGSYADAFELAAEAARELGWYCRNTGTNPFTVEGKKTAAFEVAEQLGWRAPDRVVVPVGDGNILTGVHKGFSELLELGWIGRMPRLTGVQAEGSSPIARAYAAGSDEIRPVEASTLADSISAGRPSDGARALRAARQTGGGFVTVADEEILGSIAALGRDAAVFAEPAAAAAHAGLLALRRDGALSPDEEVVLLVTGSGLKDVDAAVRAAGKAPPVIDPEVAALCSALESGEEPPPR